MREQSTFIYVPRYLHVRLSKIVDALWKLCASWNDVEI